MTDEELYNEFKALQGFVKRQGQALPITMANTPPRDNRSKTPNFHRETVREQLNVFRQELDRDPELQRGFGSQIPHSSYQNNKQLAQAGQSVKRRVGGFNRFIRGLSDLLEYNRGKREAVDKNYALDAQMGLLEAGFERKYRANFIRIHGREKGEKLYQDALQIFKRAKREQSK